MPIDLSTTAFHALRLPTAQDVDGLVKVFKQLPLQREVVQQARAVIRGSPAAHRAATIHLMEQVLIEDGRQASTNNRALAGAILVGTLDHWHPSDKLLQKLEAVTISQIGDPDAAIDVDSRQFLLATQGWRRAQHLHLSHVLSDRKYREADLAQELAYYGSEAQFMVAGLAQLADSRRREGILSANSVGRYIELAVRSASSAESRPVVALLKDCMRILDRDGASDFGSKVAHLLGALRISLESNTWPILVKGREAGRVRQIVTLPDYLRSPKRQEAQTSVKFGEKALNTCIVARAVDKVSNGRRSEALWVNAWSREGHVTSSEHALMDHKHICSRRVDLLIDEHRLVLVGKHGFTRRFSEIPGVSKIGIWLVLRYFPHGFAYDDIRAAKGKVQSQSTLRKVIYHVSDEFAHLIGRSVVCHGSDGFWAVMHDWSWLWIRVHPDVERSRLISPRYGSRA